MKILFVEDDEDKSTRISEFVMSEFPNAKISIARSFNSGLRALLDPSGGPDLLLLDMTMPNFDVSPGDPGALLQEHFAGRDLLAQMKLRAIAVPTIVVTMFDSFPEEGGKLSLEDLERRLRTQFAPPFCGLVYYNAKQEGWRKRLKELIQESERK